MGYSSYSVGDRNTRAVQSGYHHKAINEIFEQNKVRMIHRDMDPSGVTVRVCGDSKEHPNTVPILLYLDVTGSMDKIPHDMIKNGLPHLMGTLIENGTPDASLMFGAIGDHKYDSYPLQVGQFESGDAELDMWLTKTYLEGGGGGNGGESYPLAWYFADKHVQTDAFDKRGKKGFLFTIGDEPFHADLAINAVRNIMGTTAVIAERTYTAAELLKAAQKKFHVYHLHIAQHGFVDPEWKDLLGENLIEVDNYTKISKIISDIILAHASDKGKPEEAKPEENAGDIGEGDGPKPGKVVL